MGYEARGTCTHAKMDSKLGCRMMKGDETASKTEAHEPPPNRNKKEKDKKDKKRAIKL